MKMINLLWFGIIIFLLMLFANRYGWRKGFRAGCLFMTQKHFKDKLKKSEEDKNNFREEEICLGDYYEEKNN